MSSGDAWSSPAGGDGAAVGGWHARPASSRLAPLLYGSGSDEEEPGGHEDDPGDHAHVGRELGPMTGAAQRERDADVDADVEAGSGAAAGAALLSGDESADEPLTVSFRARHQMRQLKGAWLQGRAAGLGTLEGVFFPCVSSILSTVMFLRLSWAVGEAGWLGVLLMIGVGTFVNVMTALSLAAISKNGRVRGGGAYYMISRSIGPELGLATGALFVSAQSVGATFALAGLAESAMDGLLCSGEAGAGGEVCGGQREWALLGVASAMLLVMLVLLLLGASLANRLGDLATAVVLVSALTGACSIAASHGPASMSGTNLAANAWMQLSEGQSVLSIFAVVYPATTSVTAGASLSGLLRDPADSIWRGIAWAIAFTTAVYVALVLLFAAGFSRETLKREPFLLGSASVAPAFVKCGVLASTLSGAMGGLAEGGQLLAAIAADDLGVFRSLRGRPKRALLAVAALAQVCLLYGRRLDVIASLVTDCYLLMYTALNLSCFLLKVTGAPNFRPRFRAFSWRTALAGAVASLVIVIVSDPLEGMLALAATLAFAYYVHVTAPPVPWGDVSQALLFHQLRSFLLKLDDSRKSHPKFWRPSILVAPLLPGAPAGGELQLLDFLNGLKKGGLYIVGSVLVSGDAGSHERLSELRGAAAEDAPASAVTRAFPNLTLAAERLKQLWAELCMLIGAKAFQEVVVAPDLVSGFRALLMSAGMGGLRPNTVCVELLAARAPSVGGAAPARAPPAQLAPPALAPQGPEARRLREMQLAAADTLGEIRELVRPGVAAGQLCAAHATTADDLRDRQVGYCESLADVLVCEKNLLVAANFARLDKDAIVERRRRASAISQHGARKVRFPRFRFRDRHGSEPSAAAAVSDDTASGEAAELGPQGGRAENATPLRASGLEDPGLATIDLWSTSEDDWSDPSGCLALQLQLAFSLHRSKVWEQHTRLRVIAACQSVALPARETSGSDDGSAGGSAAAAATAAAVAAAAAAPNPTIGPPRIVSRVSTDAAESARASLRSLLRALRVEAEVVVLPAIGAALFDEFDHERSQVSSRRRSRREQPLTALEEAAELNAMAQEHSSNGVVVFLPLPRPPSHSRLQRQSAQHYLEALHVLVQGLPPVMLVCPGSNAAPVVTTEL